MSLLEGQEADGGITIELEDSSNGANVYGDILTAASIYWGTNTYSATTASNAGNSDAMAFGD